MAAQEGPRHPLLIGDRILLYYKEKPGYVFSELSSSKHNSVAITSREATFANVHGAIFRVVTVSKYKAQERYSELKRFETENVGKGGAVWKSILEDAKKKVDAELEFNAAEMKRLTGQDHPLRYGDSVQLQHCVTEKYVSVNQKLTSRTENTSLRVLLCESGTSDSIFKILPRYKVCSVGDVVHYKDKVKFESVKTEGQFLHCSSKRFEDVGFHVLKNKLELTLSATESPLTILPYYRPKTSHDPNTFKANQSVRLFHREHECYVSAEIHSFCNDRMKIEDVHCRKRKTDHTGRLKSPSTSANTYWQIEKERDPLDGEPLSWDERCRIRHMPTRRYLAVVSHGEGSSLEVTLKDQQSCGHSGSDQDLETVFSLSPVAQVEGNILFGSYARIKHLATATWLHLDESRYKRQPFERNASDLERLEWDDAELYKLKASREKHDDDAFTLEMVSEPLLHMFNFVAGIVPVLTTHLSQCGSSSAIRLSSKDATFVVSALNDMASYIESKDTIETKEKKNRQKLLRNLGILQRIITILHLYKAEASDLSEQCKVYQACYGVIRSYLKGDSRKNENYLARFIPLFQKQVGFGLDAEEVLVEMVENNISIVSRMAATEIKAVINVLINKRDPRFLQFLCNLCVCDERPIPSTQLTILEHLDVLHKSVFFRLEVGGSKFCPDGKKGEVFCQRHDSSEWMPLLKIAPEGCDTKSEDFQLLVSQLLLFGKMCQGNNKRCIEALSKHVTFEQAIWCVHHCCHSGQRLHPSLVSKYVELIKVMFVDIGDNRDMLENLSYSFVYEEIVEKPYKDARSDPYKALTGVVNEHFPKMNEWISHYLHAIKKTIEGEEDKFIGNELSQETKLQEMIEAHYHQLAKVLEVLSLLTKYGYYVAEGDVTKVLEPLFCILQSKPKVDEKSKEKGDHKEPFEELKSTVRERAIEVLELLFNFRFYVHLQRFIFDFRQLQDPNAGVLRSLMEVHETEDLHRPSLIYAARDQLRELFSESKFGFESDSTPDSFAETLIELSSCNNDKLVQRSLHLLNRHFSAETTLFQRAVQTQLLITKESKEVFEDIEKQLPTLRRYLSVDLSDDTSTKVVKILKSFTAMCQLSAGDDQPCTTHIYPHTQNQKILYNIGVFSCILDYVLEIAMEPPESVTCALRDVCMECFRFLRMLARNNSKVQKRLYEQMDILLEIKVAVPNMVMAMVEAFTNHADNCLRVKEQQVEKIFQLVTASDEARPELIDLLQVIIKLEDIDLPVERTENMIMKYFNKSWGSFCSNLLGEGMVKVREEVLMKVEEHKDLQLLLSITDLLASCAEGENLFVESTCQSIFKVEELLHILCNCEISPERKRPFAQFLINVYFNTDEEDDHSEICSLTTDRDMWRYLEHISVLVENIRIALQAIPDTEHQKVCDALLPQCRSTSQEKQTTKIPAIRTTSRTIEYVTLDGGELKPGILLYFMDGVLPLVHYFYAKCPDSTFKQTEDRIEKLLRITDLLLKNLLELCDTLMLYLTTDVQVKLYRSTVVRVLHFATPSVKETEMVKKFVAKTCESKKADAESKKADVESKKADANPILKKYMATYHDEMELNTTFNNFVKNFQLAYEGPNEAQFQIEAKYRQPYCSKEGDGDLPLGPSFQQHVKMFLCHREGGGVRAGGRSIGPFLPHGAGADCSVRSETANLIKQLEISFQNLSSLNDTERQEQDQLDITTLRILRALVHNEIKKINPLLSEENVAEYREQCKRKVQPVQNQLQDFGNVVCRVVPLLAHPNKQIVVEVLAFLKVMLFSGNPTVQKDLKKLIEKGDETLLTTVKTILQRAAIRHKERRALLYQVWEREAIRKHERHDLIDQMQVGDREDYNDRHTEEISNREQVEVQDSATITMEPAEEDASSVEEEVEDLSEVEKENPDPYEGLDRPICEVVKFQDSICMKLVLQVLGSMCDGQNQLMQNYLREQKGNIHTINIVALVASTTQHFFPDVGTDTMEIVHLMLQTLIEMCVANIDNQQVIYNSQVIMDVLNAILQIQLHYKVGDEYQRYKHYELKRSIDLKGSAVELIEAMLEETSSESKKFAKRIADTLDRRAVWQTMRDFFHLKRDPNLKKEYLDDDVERGLFRAYHILKRLEDYELDDQKLLSKHLEADDEMLRDYCSCRSKSVEILYENPSKKKILTKVYFQLEPDSDLREVIVEKVKWQINRDSAEHKLRDFLMWMKPVKRDTLHHRWLNHHPLTKYLFNYPTQRYWLLLFITLLLNLFLLLTFSVPEDRRNDATNATWPDAAGSFKPDVQNYFRSFLLFVLGGFHLLLALWMGTEYFVVNYPHFFLLVPSFISKAKDRVNKSENSWLEKYFYKFLASNMAQYIICRLTKRKKTPIAINIYGLSTLYVVLFLLASILSLGFHGYFYPICLLYIIVNNDILQRVLRAVTKNGVSLLWVAALGGVVLFIYAVIVFAFLHESAKDKGEKPFYCDNLGTCFISVIRWGLLENLGLAIPHVPQQFETSGLRILFDVSFFIIVTTIGLNIVFGIIVDTFTELRDERYRTEEDMKSKCFICDIERHEFEHEEDGFKLHVERDHNMWAYIYYSMYLDGIDTNAHSAIEKFVFDKMKDKKFDFFPVNKAKCLEKKEEDETKKQLAELNEKVTLVLSRFEKQEHEQMRLTKQQEQDEWNKNAIKRRQSSLVSGASVDEPALASRSPTHGD